MCWPVYWIIVDRTGVEIPLDVMLSSLGYGAALLCSSAGGGWKCAEAAGVVDLRGCSRESCVVYPRSTQVKLRGDLLLWVASVMYPSVGVFSYYGLDDDVCLTVILSFI